MSHDHKVRIEDSILNQVKDMLSEQLEDDVTLHMFTSKGHCLLCNETLSLVEQVAAQSDKVKVDHCECENLDNEKAKKYKIERHPAIVIEGKAKGLVRFFGIPSGYEFSSLIQAIIDVSKGGDLNLDDETIEEVKAIDRPVHLQVFVTPTCPYCPGAVQVAHKFAILNENITADMIEATEFQELSVKFKVQGVPKTVINDEFDLVGAAPPRMFLDKIQEADLIIRDLAYMGKDVLVGIQQKNAAFLCRLAPGVNVYEYENGKYTIIHFKEIYNKMQ